MKNVIYKIRNVVNNHYYVGSTVDSRKRFWSHRKDLRTGNHVCVHLQRAWNKYGEDCFRFEIVEQLNHKDELFPAEQKWLDDHFGKDYCYNVAAYADAPMRDASPELRAKLAERTKAWLERDGHPRQGAEWSAEQKEVIRQSRIGKHAGEEHYRYGKTVSEEVRKKIGDTQRGVKKAPGRTVSEEGKTKIRIAAEAGHYSHWAGKTHTEEAKAKMSKRVIEITSNSEFPSLTAVLKHYGMTMPTLNRALKADKKISKGKFAGLWFRYLGITVDKPNT
jgi:group I intron endonuclease